MASKKPKRWIPEVVVSGIVAILFAGIIWYGVNQAEAKKAASNNQSPPTATKR